MMVLSLSNILSHRPVLAELGTIGLGKTKKTRRKERNTSRDPRERKRESREGKTQNAEPRCNILQYYVRSASISPNPR